ncbi:PH domain-containing protein [Corynebacterium aquatimens]|uniref:Low molecular weight protein antigen 6 PH domain-containing protein n=1 Tax=Corynebacterium aquatimens TaxID=1190508 RepID=A0A931DWB2_9CORY|nr:PH domain-containing protein [Corynebacterium aquatimens]MBG6121427.1 hypothetical protein [Corynebacterium aquatimens]
MTSTDTPAAHTEGRTFAPDRTHLVAVFFMVGMALIGISWAPLYLGWILIFPVLFIIWVFTAKTHVSDAGVDITYLFKKNVHIDWDDFEGVSFSRASANATTTTGAQYPMPGVTFNSLPELSEASNGRITDVITGAAEAADGMIEVIDHNGDGVLMTKEEYERHLAATGRASGDENSTKSSTDKSSTAPKSSNTTATNQSNND